MARSCGNQKPSRKGTRSDGQWVFNISVNSNGGHHVSGYRKPVYNSGIVDRERSGLEFDETLPEGHHPWA